jgi:cell division protease FtsH
MEVKPPSQWFVVVHLLWFRQAQGSNNAAMSFGKSRARMFSGEHPTVTFADVAGAKKPSRNWRKSSSS